MKKKVAILGATGYTGQELLLRVASHPSMEVVSVTSGKNVGKRIHEFFPKLRGRVPDLVFGTNEDAIAAGADGVFSCLHHAQSAAEIVPWLERTDAKVVDLSADFRIADVGIYEKYYGKHPRPDLLAQSVYGISEWYPERISASRLIGNPGCYTTSILVPVVPLVESGLVSAHGIIADCKSGVSGAGKTPTDSSHFPEASENFSCYKPADEHRHVAELNEQLSLAAGENATMVFTPHLVPMIRGILSSIYLRTTRQVSHDEVVAVLKKAYDGQPFIDVLEKGLPQTSWVRDTNRCVMGVKVVPASGLVLVVSVIDNIVKGASGQALQNMNLMFGFDQTLGLN